MTICQRCGTASPESSSNLFCFVCGASISSSVSSDAQSNHISANHNHEETNAVAATNLLAIFCDILFSPSLFFSKLSERSDSYSAWLFALACGTVGVTAAALIPHIKGHESVAHIGGKSIGFVILAAPFMTMLTVLFSTLYTQLILKMTGSCRRSFGLTFKAMCYVQAPNVLNIIPVFGPIISSTWSVFIWIAAISNIHGVRKLKLSVALLLPMIVVGVMIIMVFFLAIFAGVLAFMALSSLM